MIGLVRKMKKFNYSNLKNKTYGIKVTNYLTQKHEEKGKQQLFLKQKPEDLEKLVIIAKIQSTESSKEIEGIITTNTRLKQLVNEKTTPKNRTEEEIACYRDTLNIVHENFNFISIISYINFIWCKIIKYTITISSFKKY